MARSRRPPTEAEQILANWKGTLQQVNATLKVIDQGGFTRDDLVALAKLCPTVEGRPVLHPSHPALLEEIYLRRWRHEGLAMPLIRVATLYGTEGSPFYQPVFRRELEEIGGLYRAYFYSHAYGATTRPDRAVDYYAEVRDFLILGDEAIRIHDTYADSAPAGDYVASKASFLVHQLQNRPDRWEHHTGEQHDERVRQWLAVREVAEQHRPDLLWSDADNQWMEWYYTWAWEAGAKPLTDSVEDRMIACVGPMVFFFYSYYGPPNCVRDSRTTPFHPVFFNEIVELLPATGVTADDQGFHVDDADVTRRLFEFLDREYGIATHKIRTSQFRSVAFTAGRSPREIVRRYIAAVQEVTLRGRRGRSFYGDTKIIDDLRQARLAEPGIAEPPARNTRRMNARKTEPGTPDSRRMPARRAPAGS
jgi:hypothetical protein